MPFLQPALALFLERIDRGGDGMAFQQVLMNLTVNARDAMPKGGRITVKADGAEVVLLEVLEGTTAKHRNLDLMPMLRNDQIPADKPQFCTAAKNPPFDQGLLAERMVADMMPAIERKSAPMSRACAWRGNIASRSRY